MPLLQALDVIWVHDGCIRPPGPKMVVCVEPALGFFFRINTRSVWQISVPLAKRDHPFLDHDSHLECGGQIDLDDYMIEQALAQRGVIGQISAALVPAILAAIDAAQTLSALDKDTIRRALGG